MHNQTINSLNKWVTTLFIIRLLTYIFLGNILAIIFAVKDVVFLMFASIICGGCFIFYVVFSFIKIANIIEDLNQLHIYEMSISNVEIFELKKFYEVYANIKKYKYILISPFEIVYLNIILKEYLNIKYIYFLRTVHRIDNQMCKLDLNVKSLNELYIELEKIVNTIEFINKFLKFAKGNLSDKQIICLKDNYNIFNAHLNNSQKYIYNTLLIQYKIIIKNIETKTSPKVLLELSNELKKSIQIHKNTFNKENEDFSLKILDAISEVYNFCNTHVNININTSMDYVDGLNGLDFEKFCANLLNEYGFVDLHVTKGSGDQGVDVIGYLNGAKIAIQCKRYNKKLGNSPIQEVAAGKNFYKCDEAIVLTNSYFTDGAIKLAETNNVILWDRDVLEALIYKTDLEWKNLLEKTINIM